MISPWSPHFLRKFPRFGAMAWRGPSGSASRGRRRPRFQDSRKGRWPFFSRAEWRRAILRHGWHRVVALVEDIWSSKHGEDWWKCWVKP
jgi:hypothetical protein